MRNDAHPADADGATGTDERTPVLTTRRRLLTSLPSLLASSLPAVALGSTDEAQVITQTQRIIDRANARGMPDTLVTTHRGDQLLFHRDLVRDRVVLINFMSINEEREFPVCANLGRLVRGLGDRFGREIFAISVSYDAVNDTPERLAVFAKEIGAPDGWDFVTASAEDVIAVGYKLYRSMGRPRRQMDADLIHYGNAKVGLWSSMSAHITDVPLAVSRVCSVLPSPPPVEGEFRRAGPRPLAEDGPCYDHRDRTGTVCTPVSNLQPSI
ncbi:MAG: hypothetical protein AB7F83_07085 [Lysobacterales bacterium]